MFAGEGREVRTVAMHSLETMGPGAASPVPRLLELLKDDDVGVVLALGNVLVRIGAGAKDAARRASAPSRCKRGRS